MPHHLATAATEMAGKSINYFFRSALTITYRKRSSKTWNYLYTALSVTKTARGLDLLVSPVDEGTNGYFVVICVTAPKNRCLGTPYGVSTPIQTTTKYEPHQIVWKNVSPRSANYLYAHMLSWMLWSVVPFFYSARAHRVRLTRFKMMPQKVVLRTPLAIFQVCAVCRWHVKESIT